MIVSDVTTNLMSTLRSVLNLKSASIRRLAQYARIIVSMCLKRSLNSKSQNSASLIVTLVDNTERPVKWKKLLK